MDALLFHPKVVHIPMALAVLMPIVAGSLLLAWWRNWLPRRAWWVVVALQAALVGSGVAALRTGEAEEERVESVVAKQLIEGHEEAAEVFTVVSGAVLAVMVLASALRARRAALTAGTAAALGTLVVLALGYRTGQAGGDLVYRHGAAQAYGGNGTSGIDRSIAPARLEKHDD